MDSENRLMEVYIEVEENGLREKFDRQVKKMKEQDKHKYKSIADKWEYALYRIKGGESLLK
jgi:ABC-type amino acid transport substrate-binding protein